MAGDVFEEDAPRLTLADDPRDLGPEVAGVLGAEAFARVAERLARIARREDIHKAAPRAAVEGGKVIPQRRLTQGLVFHPGHEGGRGESVSLDVTNSAVAGLGDVQTEFEPAPARAERESPECPGRWSQVIHARPGESVAGLDARVALPR